MSKVLNAINTNTFCRLLIFFVFSKSLLSYKTKITHSMKICPLSLGQGLGGVRLFNIKPPTNNSSKGVGGGGAESKFFCFRDRKCNRNKI